MKILCIGHAAYDITIPVKNFILENSKNRVDKILENGGGPACTAAYLLGKWHQDVTFVGTVGNDVYGKKIIEELESVNVNTQYIKVDKTGKTTSSFIIANEFTGSRTILTYRDSYTEFDNIELDFEPNIILIDGQEAELSTKIIKKYPNAISIIDAGRVTDEIIELSKLVNYVICSKDFAEKLTSIKIDINNSKTLIDVYKKLETTFGNNIIVTLESAGCLYKFNNILKIMPSLKVKSIDSTGAGDIFHGTFVYGMSKNYDLETILRLSNIAGAISVTYLGSRNSILTLEEMRKYNENFR